MWVIPGPNGSPILPLVGLRSVVWYDEKLNGLTLTVIGNIPLQTPELRLSFLTQPLF